MIWLVSFEMKSCTCHNEDVMNILMQLTEIGILQKQNDYYKYNPIGIL